MVLAAGLVDSLGLAIGWTTLSLHVVATKGLGALGLLNGAMFVGIIAAAPLTGVVSSRLDGRALLRWTAGVEALTRTLLFAAVIGGAPLVVILVCAGLSSVVAWIGFAGMRAEVGAAGDGARGLSLYTAGIAAAESGGAFLAAALPQVEGLGLTPGVGPWGWLGPGVLLVYSLSLVPTMVVASGARTPRQRRAPLGGVPHRRLLATGGLLAALATGPTLLAVGLAAVLHGQAAVGPALLAYTIGSLCGPVLAGQVSGRRQSPVVVWCGVAALMVVGWPLAGHSLAGLLLAQLLAGVGLSAFEGVMDADLAERTAPTAVTGVLAWSASARAAGSAVAVAGLPLVADGPAVGPLVGGAAVALLVIALIGLVRNRVMTADVAAPAPWTLVLGSITSPELAELPERDVRLEPLPSGFEMRHGMTARPARICLGRLPQAERLIAESWCRRGGEFAHTPLVELEPSHPVLA
ncbi:MFS transporter [Euzebya tangerina]|uniref:MFS transporter n=1 Tax=Euzebya tangerina TaxID=591198 RepID=UPI0013C2E7E4|nr:MFS transporter [Euzebya tangerina]